MYLIVDVTLEEEKEKIEEMLETKDRNETDENKLIKLLSGYKDSCKRWTQSKDCAKIAPMGPNAVYFVNNALYVHKADRTISAETISFETMHYQILSDVITGMHKMKH